MNKLILLSFGVLTICAGAEEVAMTSNSSQMNSNGKMNSTPPPEPNVVTLTSAVPNSSNGWYVFADALYWHADVGSADWAFKNNNTAADPEKIKGPNHALNFKWAWGFRAGIGANMDYDQWDTNVYYTWFQTNNSNAVGTKGSQIAHDLVGLATVFTQGKIHWRIHYSMLDWELGRWFYVSKHLSLRPHIGVKGGWISQKVQRSFTKPQLFYKSKVENEFWGVGPCGGVNTTWVLGSINTHHFSLFGDFAGALMYGHFDVENEEEFTSIATGEETSEFEPSKLNRNLAVPMLQAILGFSWDTGYNRDRCHFGLRVGYEFQYWFRQNQMLANEFFGAVHSASYNRAHDDLAFQGLTIDFKFDF
jgi:hypothetical protein